MKLNRAELRKIIYDFNSISNRLLQADFEDYTGVVKKFVTYIKSTPIIADYINDCGLCEQNMEQEFDVISGSYGRRIFSLGDSDIEEVRNVYAILCYIADNNKEIYSFVAMGYSASKKYQDRIKGFNQRVAMVLIRHIESYLTKIGIDMGIDEKTTYSIKVENGQVNIANDNSTIIATNLIGVDAAKLKELLQEVRNTAGGLTADESDIMESNLEVVEAEAQVEKQEKGF